MTNSDKSALSASVTPSVSSRGARCAIRVRPDRKTLFLDLHHDGHRYRRYTSLPDTVRNRESLSTLRWKIEQEAVGGGHDLSIYFPAKVAAVNELPLPTQRMAAGHDTFPSPTLRQFLTIWERDCTVGWRPSYRRSVRSMLETHLLPAFGETPISEVDRAALLHFRAQLADRRSGKTSTAEGRLLNATTINRIVGLLSQILDEGAMRHDYVNPALKIRRLKTKRIEIQPFSMEEVRRIIDTVRPDYRNYLTIRFFTGMRSAEAHGLRWKHIDFERREILIRETYANGRTEYTKTDGSQREVQMSQPVMEALRKLKPTKDNPEAYVFCTRKGQPIDNPNFNTRVWAPLLRYLELKPRRPYQMRHTCATLWLAAGENPQWIARQLGHTTTEMLFRTYSRYVPNLTRNDGSAFDRMVTGAVNGGFTETPGTRPAAKPDVTPKTRSPRLPRKLSVEIRHDA